MIRRVARASWTASATAPTPPWTRVMSAAAIAAPVPVATAMPMSAAASAGASLMPSPIIATAPRSRRSCSTSADLSCGSSPAWTLPMPTARAVAVAACSVSPVASTGSSPSARSRATPPALSGRRASAIPSSRRTRPSMATATGVCAASASSPAGWFAAEVSTPAWVSQASDPACTCRIPVIAVTPRPATASTSLTAAGTRPLSSPAATTARARGCSEDASAPAARASASRPSLPSSGSRRTTAGCPTVSVPVLSSTTVARPWILSRLSPPRISSPSWAPRPVPAMMATGVASPRAQGHATTSTATAVISAATIPAPASSQPARVAAATARMTGTNTAEIRSASRCVFDFSFWAASTSAMIWPSTVSAPVRATRSTSGARPFTVPPVSSSPGRLSRGSGSPVSIDSSTLAAPSASSPSAGMASPGRTRATSPARSVSAGTSIAAAGSPRWPLEARAIRCATRGCSSARASIAAPARARPASSRYLPTAINVMISAATS